MRRTMAPWVAMLLLTAGCLGTPPSSTDAGPAPPPPAMGPRLLEMADCGELNFVIPIPAARAGSLAPFRPVPMDPGGLTFPLVITGLSCAVAHYEGQEEAQVTGMFLLVPVEPLPGREVPDAVGYLYQLEVASLSHVLLSAAKDLGTAHVDEEAVSVGFEPLMNRPDARGSFGVGWGGKADTIMAGDAEQGQAGTLGLYTMIDSVVRTHQIDYTDYRTYRDGVAVVDPGPIMIPLPVPDPPGPTTAWHNLDFDLVFRFDVVDPPAE